MGLETPTLLSSWHYKPAESDPTAPSIDRLALSQKIALHAEFTRNVFEIFQSEQCFMVWPNSQTMCSKQISKRLTNNV